MELILALPLILSILFPPVHLMPQPSQPTCTATEEDLAAIKSALQKATGGRTSPEDIIPQETLDRCPMLKAITGKIQSVADEIIHLKESSVPTEQVEELKEAFEQKVNEIMKTRDIFEKQSNLETTEEHGRMIDRMLALQVQVANMEKEIAEMTNAMYEDMAELIFERLRMNSTALIHNYTRHMLEQKLDQLMRKLETDHKVFLGALRFLNHLKEQTLIDKVFDEILKRLDEMDTEKDLESGKYIVVNLLCWTVNNRFLVQKYQDKEPEVLRMAAKFYSYGGSKEQRKKDVRSRQYCDAKFPVHVIAGLDLSRG